MRDREKPENIERDNCRFHTSYPRSGLRPAGPVLQLRNTRTPAARPPTETAGKTARPNVVESANSLRPAKLTTWARSYMPPRTRQRRLLPRTADVRPHQVALPR